LTIQFNSIHGTIQFTARPPCQSLSWTMTTTTTTTTTWSVCGLELLPWKQELSLAVSVVAIPIPGGDRAGEETNEETTRFPCSKSDSCRWYCSFEHQCQCPHQCPRVRLRYRNSRQWHRRERPIASAGCPFGTSSLHRYHYHYHYPRRCHFHRHRHLDRNDGGSPGIGSWWAHRDKQSWKSKSMQYCSCCFVVSRLSRATNRTLEKPAMAEAVVMMTMTMTMIMMPMIETVVLASAWMDLLSPVRKKLVGVVLYLVGFDRSLLISTVTPHQAK